MILLDLLLIGLFSGVFAIGLFGHYGPKIKRMEKAYNNLNSKIKDQLMNMSEEERKEFLSNLSNETREFYKDILNGNNIFGGIHHLNSMQEHITYSMEHMDDLDNIQFQQFTEWAMDESLKAVTPFDHGGYVQGPGFNPSDTMHHDMNNFNHDMDHGMHDSMNSGMDNHFNGF